jgi:uncharacterized protein (AIM24 family)|tara:strand:- start:18 stop:659 length:642 start_codon:yes stop_codon:yes gene_type:complete
MHLEVTDFPNSFLKIKMKKNESIISEKGSFIFSDGKFSSQNKLEFKSYKNLIAKIGGKSLSYVCYKAKEDLEMNLGTRDNTELTIIRITENNQIMIKADAHFSRTSGLELELIDKSIGTLFDGGFWMSIIGEGYLIIKGYGRIIEMDINRDTPLLIEEDSLIAFEKNIDFTVIETKISDEVGQLVKSGVEVPFSVKGKGVIWLQTKAKYSLDD